ncbi:galactose oxidase-like protein [Carex littledalei]|uniref:Galactose oxidase-like protein n=1 Tax=Carex littledalei TaxID=544730 RepID=A0A833VQ80_9POAL|nr:galactose oxidase-like protein [Carex littledalei]
MALLYSLLLFSLLHLTTLQPTSGNTFSSLFSSPTATINSPATAGEWRLLSDSIGIVAMHMQLLPGNRLLTFDRTDFGLSNLSFPNCPFFFLDCTAHSLLYDISKNTISPLPLLSDPWCSSAALLPNGSLLQTGGFNTGDRSVRLFSLYSLSWIEHPYSLAVRRWYASNQLLPDGTVIVVGGRRQFNFEFFPPDQQYQLFDFPFLQETSDPDSENNLYPFLHLLPDGSLFIFANTRSIVFNPLGRSTTRSLPPLPDGVPRNYPSSGSSVLLPLRPEAPSRAEVLICGGAPRGAFQSALRNATYLPATRTCARIVPTDSNPQWSMEEMPLPRVMGDMVILPTGEILIINGAAAGTAGWELAQEPVLHPVLYRPDRPAGYRFEVMNPSTIPRMYHSSAILDSYGRVLIGGSNPHVGYVFQNVTYPTDLSLEAYLPPYLDATFEIMRPRRVVVGPPAEVGYGDVALVRFAVDGGLQEGMAVEVVAIAPAFATHSVGMNQRMVVMTVLRLVQLSFRGYMAEVLAPPSPEVAPPGFYMWFVLHGGVPSQAVWVRIRQSGAFSNF